MMSRHPARAGRLREAAVGARHEKTTLVSTFLALALAGCSTTAAPVSITVTPEPVRPALASECYAPSPAEPVLAASGEAGAATALDVVRHIEARKAHARALVRLRAVCRASLTTHFGDPAAAGRLAEGLSAADASKKASVAKGPRS